MSRTTRESRRRAHLDTYWAVVREVAGADGDVAAVHAYFKRVGVAPADAKAMPSRLRPVAARPGVLARVPGAGS